MRLPTIRASLSRSDTNQLVELVSGGDPRQREAMRERIDAQGADQLLDDPRTLNTMLTGARVSLRPELVFYVLVRHALLEGGIDDRGLADYVASLVYRFGRAGQAYRVSDGDDREYRYMVDLVAALRDAGPERRFQIDLHMGDFALWITGMFPDHLGARERRRGAPPLSYYQQVGAAGYRRAAASDAAGRIGLDALLRSAADHFGATRVALNRVSDRYLMRRGADPVERLLREVTRGGA